MSATTLPRPSLERGGPPEASRRSGGLGFIPPTDRQQQWGRPALIALLVATGVLYIWGLGASGWANSFYSAAVQAGTKSWKAFFFGSSDAANFITIDKPPAALWIMELSAARPTPRPQHQPSRPDASKLLAATPTRLDGTTTVTGARGSSPLTFAIVDRRASAALRP